VWDVIYKYTPQHLKTSEFYEKLKRNSLTLLESGTADSIQKHDHLIIRPNGTKRIVHSITFPIRIGSKFMFGSLIRDITEQKEAERKLRESEERYKTLSENFPDGALFLFNKDLRYIFCDGKGLANAGFSKEDFIGKTPKDIFSPDHTAIIEKHCYPVFQGQTTQYELILNDKIYTNKAVPVYNDAGEINEGIVITQEITKQKQNEQKLKEQQRKLAKSNQDLLSINEELQDAQEALQTVNAHLQRKVEEKTADIRKLVDQKDDFIHMLSHDLKNPLTPILSLLPMVAEKSEDPKVKMMIHRILSNTRRMKSIIQETLTLAQISDQGKQIHPSAFILSKEIKRILTDHQSFFDENHVNLQVDINDDYEVYFDKAQFDHLISNIITNAVKYTPDDARCNLMIKAKSENDHVVFSIADNGVGLTDDQQQQVFDKFYHTGKPRKGMESTGLGLSICKRIIEKHGGKIWVESDGPNKGSTFSFTIPLTKQS
jgi:PAS domain S-box-containing protein